VTSSSFFSFHLRPPAPLYDQFIPCPTEGRPRGRGVSFVFAKVLRPRFFSSRVAGLSDFFTKQAGLPCLFPSVGCGQNAFLFWTPSPAFCSLPFFFCFELFSHFLRFLLVLCLSALLKCPSLQRCLPFFRWYQSRT